MAVNEEETETASGISMASKGKTKDSQEIEIFVSTEEVNPEEAKTEKPETEEKNSENQVEEKEPEKEEAVVATTIIDSLEPSDDRLSNLATFDRPGLKKKRRGRAQVKRFADIIREDDPEKRTSSSSSYEIGDQIDFNNPFIPKDSDNSGLALAAVLGKSKLRSAGMKTKSGRFMKPPVQSSTESNSVVTEVTVTVPEEISLQENPENENDNKIYAKLSACCVIC